MEISVSYSPQSEANRLLHTLVQTANGLYFHKNFALTPESTPPAIPTATLSLRNIL